MLDSDASIDGAFFGEAIAALFFWGAFQTCLFDAWKRVWST
jgi:hypothetical protein